MILTDNLINSFIKLNPEIELSLDSLFILRSFTLFEARVYEQIFLTQLMPKLNGSYTVIFPFTI
ncbi:hypothetical protein GCM10023339_73170 [Alloalcanivorax gelatiniphagus]